MTTIPDDDKPVGCLEKVIGKFFGAKKNPNVELLRKVKVRNYKVKFMVATVPDPVVSQFGQWFDAMVDAIQRAVEQQEFAVLDRYWFPWRPSGQTKPAGENGDGPAGKGAGSPLFTHQPGVLLFRSTQGEMANGHKELVAVFLVGETPTAGIHKEAMTTSLGFIGDAMDLGVADDACKDGHIRVLSPTFSGSDHSLRMALQAWHTSAAGSKKAGV